MSLKNFLKKHHINLFYGISLIPSYLLLEKYPFVLVGIGDENFIYKYSAYKNHLYAIELLFLLFTFILLFSLYKNYNKKYKKTLLSLIIVEVSIFSIIVINSIYSLSVNHLTFIDDIRIILIYWAIHLFGWGFYQKQDGIKLNLFKDTE